MLRDNPLVIVLLVAIIVGMGYYHWHRFRWLHDPALVTVEGRMGRRVCDEYCDAAGGIVTEVRAVFPEGGAHILPECICLVEEGVDPE